ncbi:MAG: hypothetical protein PHC61_09450 [Chitinivibrionales bacterium]|nr:hypothetical protein [Chitinivibrionales bacterium]
MVKGLDIFRAYFQEYSDRYILIGGTACDLAMEKAGVGFRATKDLDIVLCVEALDKKFVESFWAFVKAGKYQIQEKSAAGRQFYRFQKPQEQQYPFMLELFSRKPDALALADESHLTPIPIDEDVSSLSAILLNDDYYQFIREGKTIVDGLPIVGPDRLIPLKARAWLDLTERKKRGENIDSTDIKKHKNDVFRLYQILNQDSIIATPQVISEDMKRFIDPIALEKIDLKALGLGKITLEKVLVELTRIYGLGL